MKMSLRFFQGFNEDIQETFCMGNEPSPLRIKLKHVGIFFKPVDFKSLISGFLVCYESEKAVQEFFGENYHIYLREIC